MEAKESNQANKPNGEKYPSPTMPGIEYIVTCIDLTIDNDLLFVPHSPHSLDTWEREQFMHIE
jgi:hypothetical protein